MCGILAIASTATDPLALADRDITRMRDRLAHRGPDDAGLARLGPVALAHTRLAVIDPTPAGHQPMATPDGRFTLVYNGELYNDRELRQELTRNGARFQTDCDTETVLHALATWGAPGLDRMRGMYALALYDRRDNTLLLARDPLGIKPLYLWQGSLDGRKSFIAASEIPAILAHPDIAAEPDPLAIHAYLTTLRTSIARQTMFRGIQTLLPAERVQIDLTKTSPQLVRTLTSIDAETSTDMASADLAGAIEDSVVRHLRADVPMCCLLSGGVDSSIIATIANEHVDGELHTYCAGARENDLPESPDFAPARLMAHTLGANHTEVPITRSLFLDLWHELIASTGSPLSTPNEVAIFEVARAMRAHGHIVTLSGEGADELFGGYNQPLTLAQSFIDQGGTDSGAFQLDSFAWMSRDARTVVLQSHGLDLQGSQSSPTKDVPANPAADPLLDHYRAIWDRSTAPNRPDEPLLPHIRFQRTINLSGLLRRLDSMTMLASVEGRTPLADIEIARIADALPVSRRYQPASLGKLALREAFADRLPEQITNRPKASFPLPFETWIDSARGWLRDSSFAKQIFNPAAMSVIDEAPSAHWQLAWPMINVALWGDRWF